MTAMQWITCILLASPVFLALSIIVTLLIVILRTLGVPVGRPRSTDRVLFGISAVLLVSLWCLRYSTGFYSLLYLSEETSVLTWWEEIFESLAYALKTFGIDDNYGEYIVGVRAMAGAVMQELGWGAAWVEGIVIYASALNFLAPLAGGALLFQILANVFPRFRLWSCFWMIWNMPREKYFFSKLNEQTVALVKSFAKKNRRKLFKPVMIITDAYADSDEEKASELLQAARHMGAICLRDDLTHVYKRRIGHRIFFLMDEDEMINMHALSDLTDKQNNRFLKNAEICFFSQEDMYTGVERSVLQKLRTQCQFKEKQLPIIHPVRIQQNLIFKLLEDVPLYAPLIGKKRNANGEADLTLTILGMGYIGTEMLLSAYWCGQMLGVRLAINVVSKEAEADFWAKLDFISPEIRKSCQVGNEILRVKAGNGADAMAAPYCTIRYRRADIGAEEGLDLLMKKSDEKSEAANGRESFDLSTTDYFLVALGSDRKNMQVADSLRQFLGREHFFGDGGNKTVIAYVVYDSALCEILNIDSIHDFSRDRGFDVYMRAIGSLEEVYDADTVFMTKFKYNADAVQRTYRVRSGRTDLKSIGKKRMKDGYSYWSNMARAVHLKYKMFSAGVIEKSLFQTGGIDTPEYAEAYEKAASRYVAWLNEWRGKKAAGEPIDAELKRQMDRLAWLEHRRWIAFLRSRGFIFTNRFAEYYHEQKGHKNLPLKLHPCLVECDEKGLREGFYKAEMDGRSYEGELDPLDEITRLVIHEYKNSDDPDVSVPYDFKEYDYPADDFDFGSGQKGKKKNGKK